MMRRLHLCEGCADVCAQMCSMNTVQWDPDLARVVIEFGVQVMSLVHAQIVDKL